MPTHVYDFFLFSTKMTDLIDLLILNHVCVFGKRLVYDVLFCFQFLLDYFINTYFCRRHLFLSEIHPFLLYPLQKIK